MTDNISDELKSIIAEYTRNLPAKIQDIKDLWAKLNQQIDRDTLNAFHNKIHSLHGSAGMFGFPKLSDISQKIEIIVDDILTQEQISLEQKISIDNLFIDLMANASTQAPLPLIVPDLLIPPKSTNNKIFLVDLSQQLDQSSLAWSIEIQEKLKLFNYELKRFNNLSVLLDSLATTLPFILLFNLNSLNTEAEEQILSFQKTQLSTVPILFYSNNGDFALRIKAIKLNGQAYLVKPFSVDELIYELDRLHHINNYAYNALIIDDEIEVATYHATLLKHANNMPENISKLGWIVFKIENSLSCS